MGSFNLKGFYSHLPIEPGDRIGVLICVVDAIKTSSCQVIGATGIGFHPIMAPFYCKYDDSGDIYDIEENYSTKKFTEVVGISIPHFLSIQYRNNNTSLSTEDNNNRFDNIPFYQKHLKKILPEPKEYKLKIDPTDEEAVKFNSWITNLENTRYTQSTISIIYEHESILKGIINSCPMQFLTERFTIFSETVQRIKEFNELGFTQTVSRYDFSNAFTLGDCCYSDFDLCMLYDEKMDADMDEKLKEEISDTVRLSIGLYLVGGVFTNSLYGGQSVHYKKNIALLNEMQNILTQKIKKYEANSEEPYADEEF